MGQFEVSCQCAGRPLSPGQNGCMPLAKRDKFPIFMYMNGSDGSANSIPVDTTINQAYVTAKFNAVENADRWWMMPEMYNLVEPPAENEVEDRDGVPIPTGEEIKQPWTWEHSKEDANPALKAAYDSLKCNEIGVIFVTYSGQLSGINDGSGNLIPIKLQGETLFATPGRATKGVNPKMMVSMLEDELENGANYDYIDAANIAYPTKNWFALMPLEVIFTEISQTGQDTITFRANLLYGGVNWKKPITGLVTADVSPDNGSTTGEVYNETDDLNAAGTLTESSATPGLYTWQFAGYQHDGDICDFQIFKEGYSSRGFKFTIATS